MVQENDVRQSDTNVQKPTSTAMDLTDSRQ